MRCCSGPGPLQTLWVHSLFNSQPNGDYLTVRFNGKEDNLVLWTFNQRVRKFVKKSTENMPLEMKKWHSMKIGVHGTQLQGWLDGKRLLEYTLPAAVTGKIDGYAVAATK